MERILKLKGSLVLYSRTHAIPNLTAECLILKKCIATLKLRRATARIALVIALFGTVKNAFELEQSKEDTSENFK